jgi:hypothetical protein
MPKFPPYLCQVTVRRYAIPIVVVLILCFPAFAQNTLIPFQPQAGNISSGSSESWTFFGVAGQVISLLVTSDGELDPVLTLSEGSGRVLLTDDDYAYPDSRDALLQAVTLPRTDTYTAAVTGFNDTQGGYTIALSNGFAELAYQDDFSEAGNWRVIGDNTAISIADGTLNAAIRGVRAHDAIASGTIQLANVAARVEVLNVANSSGWTVGLIARQQGDDYYLYEINNEGRWRFSIATDGVAEVIRDWTSHPAIVAGNPTFSLMLMAHEVGFDLFYNDAFVGSLSDDRLTTGDVGVALGTVSSLESSTNVQFDNFTVTTPITLEGETVIPQNLTVSDGTTMAQALTRRHIASAAGTMALTVPEASVNYARPGINRLMLGQQTTYMNFAFGATVDMQTPLSLAVGCGLIVRFADEEDYVLGYLDAIGSYALSQREGEAFLPGSYGENPDWAGGGEHHLLIIADETRLYFYVNGVSVGTIDAPAQAGEVGVAVVNYEPVDTACRFENLWLWEWDT